MDTMQFRDYIFAHNPAAVTITAASRLAEHFCPGRGALVQDLGPEARVAVCSGSFSGATPREALDRAAEFRLRAADDQSGMLYLPGQEPFRARLKSFVLSCEGYGCALPYTMTFVEDGAAS